MLLLEHGKASTRSKVAECMVGSNEVGRGWAPKVASVGALPLLGLMLGCGRSDRCTYSAVLALRNLSACPEGRLEVSRAGVINDLVGLALKGSSDISAMSLSTLNYLA